MNNYLIAPDTDIYLLKVPFELDSENVLSFSTETAQYNYFSSLPKLYLENATYQRKDGVLRYPEVSDELLTYNYCMYRNNAFSNKWFYAFIEEINFVNTNMSEIKLKTDVYETWQFNISYHKMFVEREHVNNDTIGLHTVPENLETGEFITNKAQGLTYYNIGGGASTFSYANLKVVIGVTRDYQTALFTSGGEYGIYSGLKYYAFDLTNTSGINDFLEDFGGNGYLADIHVLFLAPSAITTSSAGSYYAVSNHTGVYSYTGKYTLKHDVDGYTPKNNKLYCSPYTYLMIDNHGGSAIKINLEDLQIANYFTSEAIDFSVIGTLGAGCSFYLYPTQYKNNTGINRGLHYAKLPTISWTGDAYTNWLTQNAVNNSINTTASLGSIGIGVGLALATGGVIGSGAIAGGINGILGNLTSNKENLFFPASINGNISAVDCLSADDRLEPTIYQMCVRSEYAQIIDDFFSAYGYKVNSWKVPNTVGRTNWNYVRTKNCNITGNIPQKDLQELKRMFDKGVTIWHNASTFLDYTQNNGII